MKLPNPVRNALLRAVKKVPVPLRIQAYTAACAAWEASYNLGMNGHESCLATEEERGVRAIVNDNASTISVEIVQVIVAEKAYKKK